MSDDRFADGIPHAFVRYYQAPPEEKSLARCESHGRDHAAYQWNSQIDPRWSPEQVLAYRRGYRDVRLKEGLQLGKYDLKPNE